ncbi:MAG: Na+/H+ antiporter NhaC family protein [Candidatus Aminicenantia bacterium]
MFEEKFKKKKLEFYGGFGSSVLPFLFFIAGAVYLGIKKSPDIYGFWPITLGALILGMFLAKNKTHYTDVIVEGMSQKIVMIMVCAWLFASVIGVLMYETGFVEALVWVCFKAGLTGRLFAGTAFIIAVIVGTATGTSIGTIVTCTPILYPAGYLLGAHPAVLLGAIIGGGAFGDNLSPISDTTIASALSQRADIGGVVKSRLKYAFPAGILALILYITFGQGSLIQGGIETIQEKAHPAGLPMIVVPIVIIILCLSQRHLLEALFWGIVVGCLVGLSFKLISFKDLFSLDVKNRAAQGIILEGLKGGVGISIFTIMLLGLVYSIQKAGLIGKLISWSRKLISTAKQTDAAIMLTTLVTNLIIAHNTVTIVSVGEFARQAGNRYKIHPYRRANVMDVAANTLQHIVPYMTTVIVASAYSEFGLKYGAPKLSPFAVGIHNFHSWMLLLVLILAIITGFGQSFLKDGELLSSESK